MQFQFAKTVGIIKEFFNDTTLYSLDPIEELSKKKPDVFINCSASPTRAKKNSLNTICCHLLLKIFNTDNFT